MRLKLIEQYSGKGWLSRENSNDRIADVEYYLKIHQELIPDGIGGEVEGFKQIEGTVSSGDKIGLYQMVGESLVLHMEDGRNLGMFIKDSNTGAIANRTGFYTPPTADKA